MSGTPRASLNQHERWAMRRLRKKVFFDRGPALDEVIDVLEANLLQTPPTAINVRSRQILRRVAKKATLANLGRFDMAHALVPVLLDGLAHVDPERREAAARAFVVVSQANAFRPFDEAALERTLRALAKTMSEDEDVVAIEASRQIWLLVRFHARTGQTWGAPLERMLGWNVIQPDAIRLRFLRDFASWVAWERDEPHPHIAFFAECTRVSLRNAEVPRGEDAFEAPSWPSLSPPLPDITRPFTHFDFDHDTQTLSCSFERLAPQPRRREVDRLRACGVCSARACLVLSKEEDGAYSYETCVVDLECQVCGCFTRYDAFVRMD